MKMPKKDEFGQYVYRGRTIQNIGYDRVIGHVRWSVTDEKSGKKLFSTDTLRDAIKRIDKEGDAK